MWKGDMGKQVPTDKQWSCPRSASRGDGYGGLTGRESRDLYLHRPMRFTKRAYSNPFHLTAQLRLTSLTATTYTIRKSRDPHA
jgi:hypothetical protein